MEMLVCHFKNSMIMFLMRKRTLPVYGCPPTTIPGTGKTMLMDMFYSCVETPRKKRVHFNGFMLDIHESQYPASYCGRLIFILSSVSLCCFLFCLKVPPENCLPLFAQVKPLLQSLLSWFPGLPMQVFFKACLTFVYCLKGSTGGNKAFQNERWGNCSPMTPYRRLPWR